MVDDGERNDLIRRITVGALGELAHWERPASLSSIGPAFPEVFDKFEQELSQLQAAIEGQLRLLSTDELGGIPPESEAPKLNPLFDDEGEARVRGGHVPRKELGAVFKDFSIVQPDEMYLRAHDPAPPGPITADPVFPTPDRFQQKRAARS